MDSDRRLPRSATTRRWNQTHHDDAGRKLKANRPELPPLDLATRAKIWHACLMVMSGVLVCVAIGLCFNDPEISYTSDTLSDVDNDIAVTCNDDVSNGTGDRAQRPLLDTGEFMRTRYDVTKGEDALKRVSDEAQSTDTGDSDPLAVSRGINADCAAARTSRLSTAVWVGGFGVLAALAAFVVPAIVRRSGDT